MIRQIASHIRKREIVPTARNDLTLSNIKKRKIENTIILVRSTCSFIMVFILSSETNIDRLKAIDSLAWPISRMFGLQVRANIVKNRVDNNPRALVLPRETIEDVSPRLSITIIRGTRSLAR